jgi:hypothetical protein
MDGERVVDDHTVALAVDPAGLIAETYESNNSVELRLTGRMPLGRETVKLEWQVAPLGRSFTGPGAIGGTSAGWIDTGLTGFEIVQRVD